MTDLIYTFFVALGVVTGGSLVGALGALVLGESPLGALHELGYRLKIWAMVAALGGTFESIRNIETGFLQGQLRPVARQSAYIMTAFIGAHLGYLLLRAVAGRR
jgi:hypothetical protein